jgi:hypothetical protein
VVANWWLRSVRGGQFTAHFHIICRETASGIVVFRETASGIVVFRETASGFIVVRETASGFIVLFSIHHSAISNLFLFHHRGGGKRS